MKQSEALRLADLLEYDAINNVGYHKPLVCASAAELRRLHEVNAELLAALKDIARQPEGDEDSAQAVARAAIAKTEEA